LTWSAASGAASYSILIKTIAASNWTTLPNVTALNYALANLTAATTYYCQIKSNCSAVSSAISFTTTSVTSTNCSAPGGLLATNILTTSAKLSWNPVAGATSYSVKYKLSTATNFTNVGSISTNNLQLSNLAQGKQYNWKVKANCSTFINSNFTTASALPIAIDGKSEQKLTLSPNPIGIFSDALKVDFNGEIPIGSQLILCNNVGMIVKKQLFVDNETFISVNDLNYGIYTIIVLNQGRRLAVSRFTRIE
jgi:Fibronectin type III domain